MSRFYGSIEGSRGGATRCGTKGSGIEGHIRGWNTGARVYVDVDSNGHDRVTVYRTSGSNGAEPDVTVAQWTEGDGE